MIANRKLSILLFTISFFVACKFEKQNSIYPGYSKTDSGLYYHRYTIGEGKNYPEHGDFLELQLLFFLDTVPLQLHIFKNEYQSDTLTFDSLQTHYQLYEALELLCVGDSCSFICSTAQLLDTSKYTGIATLLKKDSFIRIEAKLLKLKSFKERQEEQKSYSLWCSNMLTNELSQLQKYLDTTALPFPKNPDENGMYFYIERSGKGKICKRGDNISIRYKGKFLNGTIFDDNTLQQEALNFNLGESGQVIKGIELALYKMHEGDKAILLLPSALAFGSKGDAGGIVSPFKTVTFALEILKIN